MVPRKTRRILFNVDHKTSKGSHFLHNAGALRTRLCFRHYLQGLVWVPNAACHYYRQLQDTAQHMLFHSFYWEPLVTGSQRVFWKQKPSPRGRWKHYFTSADFSIKEKNSVRYIQLSTASLRGIVSYYGRVTINVQFWPGHLLK